MVQPTGQLIPHSDWIAKGLRLAFNMTETALYGYYNGAVRTVVPNPSTAVPSAANTTISSPYGDRRLNQPRVGPTAFSQGMHYVSSGALDVLANSMTWVFDATAVMTTSASNTGYFFTIGNTTTGSISCAIEWVNATTQRVTFWVRQAGGGSYRRASVLVTDANHHRYAVRYTQAAEIEFWKDGVKVPSGSLVNVDNTYTGTTPKPTTTWYAYRQIDACIPPNGSHVLGFNTGLSDADIETLLADPWTVQSAISADTTSPSFAGPNIADISGTEGAAITPVDVSTKFYDAESGLTFSAVGSWPAGVTVSSAGVISGTPTTAGTYAGLQVRATDAGSLTADSNAFTITVAAPGDAEKPTLTGSVTFASITQTSYTASWPAGSDNVAVTGYEYQIGSTAGAWTDAGNNLSAAITGRTAGTTETVYVRAYDAAGLRSTPAISGSVTLESIPASRINVTEPLKNNTGSVLANLSGVGVAILSASDFTYGLTTNASGILSTISDAAIITGQQYHVAIKLADGSVGITGAITAS